MPLKTLKNQSGFTLVELIVAMAASAVIMAAAVSFLTVGLKVVQQTEKMFTTHTLAILVTQKVEGELRYADNVALYDSAAGIPVYTAGTSYLYLKNDATDADQDGRLMRSDGVALGGTVTLVSKWVFLAGAYSGYRTNIAFKKTTDKTVTLTVTIKDKNGQILYATSTDILLNNQGITTGTPVQDNTTAAANSLAGAVSYTAAQ